MLVYWHGRLNDKGHQISRQPSSITRNDYFFGAALATGAATGALATGAAETTGAALAAGAEASGATLTEVIWVETAGAGAAAGADEPPQLSRSRDRTVNSFI
jgi:hypothetical protein